MMDSDVDANDNDVNDIIVFGIVTCFSGRATNIPLPKDAEFALPAY